MPKEAIFAEAGNDVHQEPNQASIPEPAKAELIAKYLIEAPITIIIPDNTAVALTPILSRITPAKIRNSANTFRKYSELANIP
jgi:hypothetical protein